MSLRTSLAFAAFILLWAIAGDWYVHHSRKWLQQKSELWPDAITAPLLLIGNPVGDFTDALGLTGHDAVYEYDTEAPKGEVLFAGAPVRTGEPAPDDVRIVSKGEFWIGWSPSLRHPLWVAYHVPQDAAFPNSKRPNFFKDKFVPESPLPGSYSGSNYDRGHMAPNYAIVTRFGVKAQKKSFLTSNISPQTPALNRGVWRELERRIADLWTARYGELWVIVGAIPSSSGNTIYGTGIDIPDAFYQVIVAQEGMDVRAMAVIYPQDVEWGEWPTRGLISIDELEKLTGLDFLPELPEFIQSPLEAELPSRLWPVRFLDALKMLTIHYSS